MREMKNSRLSGNGFAASCGAVVSAKTIARLAAEKAAR